MKKEMKLAGFNFTKILVERFPDSKGVVNLNTDINIKSIEKPANDILKEEIIKIDFVFNLIYENLGQIVLEGSLVLVAEDEFAKEILKKWKDKTLDEETKLAILNVIMQKCSLKALQLEEEMNFPYHIQLPRLSLGEEKKELKESKEKEAKEVKNSDYIN